VARIGSLSNRPWQDKKIFSLFCWLIVLLSILSILLYYIRNTLLWQHNHMDCHLRIKTGLFSNDLKFKSGLTWNGKKDVI